MFKECREINTKGEKIVFYIIENFNKKHKKMYYIAVI